MRRLVSRRPGWTQVAIVLLAVASYELLRSLMRVDWPRAVANARELDAWEGKAHLGWEAPLQRAALHVPALVEAMNALYLAASFAVTGAFFLWLYRRSSGGFRLYRNAFLLATAAALVIEWRFPTAPPRLAGIGVEDTLRSLSGIDIGSPGSRALTDPVAAMPSLHAGWALGVCAGLLAYGCSRIAKAAGVAYLIAVDLGVVVTGNHFVVDVLAGSLLVAVSLGLSASLAGITVVDLELRRGVEQSGSSPGS